MGDDQYSSVMNDEKNNNGSEENEDDDEEEGDVFEVDHIMDSKVKKGVRYFFVRWKGYDESEDSWEPEENLEGAREILAKYMADIGDKKKTGRPPKAAAKPRATKSTTPASTSGRKRGRQSKESTYESDEKEDSDAEFGKGKTKKRKAAEKPSTSGTQQQQQRPGATGYVSLDSSIRRRMNTSLRWLGDDDSDENTGNISGAIIDQSSNIPAPTTDGKKDPDVSSSQPDTTNMAGDDETDSKSKDKKKKKKSKKHSKDRERSRSPTSTPRPLTENNSTEKVSLTFLGVFYPDGASKGDYRFVARNNKSNVVSMMTLGEAYLADSWQLCRYLASKISFKPSGEQQIELTKPNGEVGGK